MDGEDQRAAPRIVVEDDLCRGIRQYAAVPIELAIDAHGREGRRQGARREDVLHPKFHVAAVEILHLAGADMGCADRQARLAAVDQRKVDELEQSLFERHRRVVARMIRTHRIMRAEGCKRVRLEESREPTGQDA